MGWDPYDHRERPPQWAVEQMERLRRTEAELAETRRKSEASAAAHWSSTPEESAALRQAAEEAAHRRELPDPEWLRALRILGGIGLGLLVLAFCSYGAYLFIVSNNIL